MFLRTIPLVALVAAAAFGLGAWGVLGRVPYTLNPTRVTVETDPERPQTGEGATLKIAMRDTAGKPMTGLQQHHGHELHVVLVDETMEVFGHVHPKDFGEKVEGGESRVRFAFPQAGKYLVAFDAMTGAGPYAEQVPLSVAGDSPEGAKSEPAAGPRLVVVRPSEGDAFTDPVRFGSVEPTDGYEVSLSRPGRIRAGETVTLTWRLTKDGEPITDLRPFLDAAMHLAVVKSDLGHFVHGHGIAKGIETGYDHAHGPGGAEAATTGADLRYFGPEIAAQLTFPEAGRYYLFGQSAHGDVLLVSRIPVDVGAADRIQ